MIIENIYRNMIFFKLSKIKQTNINLSSKLLSAKDMKIKEICEYFNSINISFTVHLTVLLCFYYLSEFFLTLEKTLELRV